MSLRRNPQTGIYQIDITIGNRRIQRSSRTTDKKKAQELHNKIENDLWRQTNIGDAPRVTWEELVLSYVDAKEREDKRSIEDDKDKHRWLLPHFKGKYIHEINAGYINKVLDLKGQEINPRTKRRIKQSTVNRYAALLSAMFRHAVTMGWLAAAPKIVKPKEPKKEPRWLRKEEANRLIAELEGTAPHIAQMVRFSLLTGLRQYNVTHLEWSRVDLKRKLAWVTPEEAKNKDFISVPLSDEAVTVLRAQEGLHKRWVFPYRNTTVANPANSAWKKALMRAGITNFRWHDLRHTWASWHVQNGTTLAELQVLGGWKTLSMVMVYAHLCPQHTASRANNVALGIGEISVKPKIGLRKHRSETRINTGGACRGRTYDKRIKSPLLYQLS
jgi:integrase